MSNLTPEELKALEIEANKYRFSAFKYGLRSPARLGPNDIVTQNSGSYAFPRGDDAVDPSVKIYDSDGPI